MKAPKPNGWLWPALVALYSAVACLFMQAVRWPNTMDWQVFYTGAQAVLHGADPYPAVLGLPSGYPFYYPYPTAMVLAPLALFPVRAAWILYAATAGALLAAAGQRYGRGLLVACLSASFLESIGYGHITPLLVAAAGLPTLGFLLILKPSIGAALWIFRPTRAAVVGCLVLLLCSLLLMPQWPVGWFHALAQTNHLSPVLRPGGFILLAAAFRWRTSEGRLMLALAFIPHTSVLYETLPLFLVPRNLAGGYVLVGASYLESVLANWLYPTAGMTIEAAVAQRWPLILMCLYLPALVMVLRQQRVQGTSYPAEVSAVQNR
ncbi:MAG: hypothetical protein ABI661_08570 [Gammaproteobacteria bacterium]